MKDFTRPNQALFIGADTPLQLYFFLCFYLFYYNFKYNALKFYNYIFFRP